MRTYSGRNKPNSAKNIWFKGLNIELKIFRLITWTTLYLHYKIITPISQVRCEGTYGFFFSSDATILYVWGSFSYFLKSSLIFSTLLKFSHLLQNVNFRALKVIKLLAVTTSIFLQCYIGCFFLAPEAVKCLVDVHC